MYPTSLLLCAILAQTPPTSLGDPAGNPPAAARPETDSPSAPTSKAGGYDTQAPPFEGQAPAAAPAAPAAANPAAAAKQPPVDTPPPTADQIAEEEAVRRAAQTKARGDRAEPAAADPAAAQAPVDKSLVPIQPRPSNRNLASEVLTNAISLPVEGRVAGRPITLVDVLRQVPDRAGQRRVTEEYWKLVEGLAIYHFAWDECQQLERLKPAAQPEVEPTPDEQLMSTRMAAAQARLRDAERGIVTAQYDLAGAMNLKAGQTLPLPIDAPHVGPYSTLLYEMYQAKGTVPPPRAVLLDRTMPIRRSAVDARAVAVQSAVDALDAVEEAYYDGRADLKLVLSLIEELSRQRRAFFADVRAYNNEIAEYAMGVPPPPGGAVGLASMLIRPTTPTSPNTGIAQASGTTGAPNGGSVGSSVERAGMNAPLGQPTGQPSTVLPAGGQQPIAEQPPVAPPPSAQPPRSATPPNGRAPNGALPPAGGAPKAGEPTLAPPRGAVEPGEQGKIPTGATVEPPPAVTRQANRAQIAEGDAAASGGAAAGNAATPEGAAAASAAAGTAVADPAADQTASHEQSLYPALLRMPSDQQARNLAGILFWHPADATPDVAPIALDVFLAAIRPEGRKTALTAYWQSQRMAATRGALVSQIEQFDSLDQELQRSISTLDPAAALLVRAARSAAEAEARRAEADCKVAQWDLAMLMGRPATGAWLAPSTAPHAGGYRLNLDQLPTTQRESTDVQRLAAAIARLPSSFCERAAVVVSADKSRVTEVTKSGGTLAGVERATLAIRAQAEYTIAFATDLAEYNQDLADYALLVLPQGTPTSMLVQALVLK